MKIQLQQIKDIINAIFSEDGYNVNNLNIQFPDPLNIAIEKGDINNISLTFVNALPKVTWKKYITFSARIIGLSLGETSGVLRLKYLPDVRFSYDTPAEQLFGNQYCFYDIEQEIYSEYQDDETRTVAKKCLHYASEWATIAGQGCDFSTTDEKTKRKLKRDCKAFVVDNIRNDKEIQAGSALLTFLFLYVVLPVILKFVLERIFKKLFN